MNAATAASYSLKDGGGLRVGFSRVRVIAKNPFRISCAYVSHRRTRRNLGGSRGFRPELPTAMLCHAAAALFRPGCRVNLAQRPRMNILQVSDSFGIRDTAASGELNRARAYVSDICPHLHFKKMRI
jgi:hypothetical protein